MVTLLLLAALLPDPTKTPGVVRVLTVAQICTTHWGVDRRHVSLSMRRAVFANYGITYAAHRRYEVDHLIPRELGGADHVQNLWPQPILEARQKDALENLAHKRVCAASPEISAQVLQMYQMQFAQDWRVVR